MNRALDVLTRLSTSPEGLTLQQLSDALDAAPATVHRLMAVLHSREYVTRAPATRRYSLGPAALSLAQGVRHIAEVARPHLQTLSSMTQETSFVTELIADRAICVALVEGTRPLRLFVRVGQEMPLHAAASARSLMAFLDHDLVEDLLSRRALTPFTEGSLTTALAVRQRLDTVRARGYDVCDEELDRHVWAAAAPVLAHDGRAVASVTLAAPTERLDDSSREHMIALVRRSAGELSSSLGHGAAPSARLTTS